VNLLDIVARNPAPEPWAEGEGIPWSDPDFSRRMLKGHLTEAHDRASPRSERIGRHVWIHEVILSSQPSRVLDIACGPGLYSSRLARLGHECTGIDFGPARSVTPAKRRHAAT
jgi:2-polyprenyl-3-methyl-5-hydroxy-6-metoxy-1,4-benzoquinol methylase